MGKHQLDNIKYDLCTHTFKTSMYCKYIHIRYADDQTCDDTDRVLSVEELHELFCGSC